MHESLSLSLDRLTKSSMKLTAAYKKNGGASRLLVTEKASSDSSSTASSDDDSSAHEDDARELGTRPAAAPALVVEAESPAPFIKAPKEPKTPKTSGGSRQRRKQRSSATETLPDDDAERNEPQFTPAQLQPVARAFYYLPVRQEREAQSRHAAAMVALQELQAALQASSPADELRQALRQAETLTDELDALAEAVETAKACLLGLEAAQEDDARAVIDVGSTGQHLPPYSAPLPQTRAPNVRQIAALPVAVLAPCAWLSTCSLCLEDLRSVNAPATGARAKPLLALPCAHVFHESCLWDWLSHGGTSECPACADGSWS